jgi:hypothetical protein
MRTKRPALVAPHATELDARSGYEERESFVFAVAVLALAEWVVVIWVPFAHCLLLDGVGLGSDFGEEGGL